MHHTVSAGLSRTRHPVSPLHMCMYTCSPAVSPGKRDGHPDWGMGTFPASPQLEAFSLQTWEPSSTSLHAYVVVWFSFSSAADLTAAWKAWVVMRKLSDDQVNAVLVEGRRRTFQDRKLMFTVDSALCAFQTLIYAGYTLGPCFKNYCCFEKVT